ncbi:MAG: HD-GYP domain-containing protein, partial [Catenulispora sp.]
MSDTRALLGKIAALRQRLEQARGDAEEAEAAAALAAPAEPAEPQPLEARVAVTGQGQSLLDTAIKRLAAGWEETEAVRPVVLTARARRVLERGRHLIGRLRGLADDPHLGAATAGAAGPDGDTLAAGLRETTAMTESALRLVQAFPEAASTQLRLCEGLDSILTVIADRVAALDAALGRRRSEAERAGRLAELLGYLAGGGQASVAPFLDLAEAVLADARQAGPLRFPANLPAAPAAAVAAHALAAAQVAARLVREDPDWHAQPLTPVVAALVCNVGMLEVPAEVFAQAGPLTDEQRRAVEAHARRGAEVVTHGLPEAAALAGSVAAHHERLDGTGYPAGLRAEQLDPLARLLAVVDVYTALCSGRPHRPPFDPRTALTDTLLLAEQGRLDRTYAERLLGLSFYPVGSVVELANGQVGVVVAASSARGDLNSPA